LETHAASVIILDKGRFTRPALYSIRGAPLSDGVVVLSERTAHLRTLSRKREVEAANMDKILGFCSSKYLE